MDWIKTLQKSILGLLTGLAAAIVFGAIQAISNYNPVVCTAEIATDCTPQFIVSAYYAVIPLVSAFLVGIANWLKNRNK